MKSWSDNQFLPREIPAIRHGGLITDDY